MKTRLIAGIAIVLVLTAFQILMASTFSLAYGDYAAFYTAARIAAEGRLPELHSEALQKSIQAPLIPPGWHPVYFVRMQSWAALLFPFGLLPFRTSFLLWVVAQALILVGGWIWAARRFGIDAAVLAAMFPPAVLGIAFGQDVAFVFGLVLLSWVLFERGWGFASGLALGICAVKPHLVFIVPLALIVQQRWRMLVGFACGGTVMLGGSMVLGGWLALPRYAAFLGRVSNALSRRPEREMNVDAILLSAGLPGALRYVLMAAVLGAVVVACRRSNWATGLTAAMLGSFLIAPHTGNYDTTVLIVGAWLTAFSTKKLAVRALATVFFTPIPWLVQLLDAPWTGLPALVLFSLLMALAWDRIPLPAPNRNPQRALA
jgi:Glycosyltransferase family 87